MFRRLQVILSDSLREKIIANRLLRAKLSKDPELAVRFENMSLWEKDDFLYLMHKEEKTRHLQQQADRTRQEQCQSSEESFQKMLKKQQPQRGQTSTEPSPERDASTNRSSPIEDVEDIYAQALRTHRKREEREQAFQMTGDGADEEDTRKAQEQWNQHMAQSRVLMKERGFAERVNRKSRKLFNHQIERIASQVGRCVIVDVTPKAKTPLLTRAERRKIEQSTAENTASQEKGSRKHPSVLHERGRCTSLPNTNLFLG